MSMLTKKLLASENLRMTTLGVLIQEECHLHDLKEEAALTLDQLVSALEAMIQDGEVELYRYSETSTVTLEKNAALDALRDRRNFDWANGQKHRADYFVAPGPHFHKLSGPERANKANQAGTR